MKYLKQRRINVAASMLLRTSLSIQQIGTRVAMPEPAIFSRTFRAHFGASPSTYRKQMLFTHASR